VYLFDYSIFHLFGIKKLSLSLITTGFFHCYLTLNFFWNFFLLVVYYEQMIKAKLENGVQIILSNGEWSCDDPELAEMLNISQEYWRSQEDSFYPGSTFEDNLAAAKVLAQFGGEVSFISSDGYAPVLSDEQIYC